MAFDVRIEIATTAFDALAALAHFAEGRSGAGALASFVGYCRATSEGAAVERLELEHYPGFTESEVTRLAEATALRHGVLDLLVIHRVGAIPADDVIVLVAVLAPHRAGAFAAVEELMDYLKVDAPIWKREIGAGGARWVEPTDADRARRAMREQGE